ncbi:hypothetical protein [Streptomyces kronopolitis]|uniref:hypothetical protein n=1 Tax=Streptomyces kronopolitis TaxID=1612435 RepID=UPI0036C20A83
MAIPWRRIAVPIVAVAVLVPAGLGAQALLSPDSTGDGENPGAPIAYVAPVAKSGSTAGKSNASAKPTPALAVSLSSYQPQLHQAVLKTSGTVPIKAGDVIASPPTSSAPSGALFKVKEVTSSRDDLVTVTTAPATIVELLGSSSVDKKTGLTPDEIDVKPLSTGVTAQKLEGIAPSPAASNGATHTPSAPPAKLPTTPSEASSNPSAWAPPPINEPHAARNQSTPTPLPPSGSPSQRSNTSPAHDPGESRSDPSVFPSESRTRPSAAPAEPSKPSTQPSHAPVASPSESPLPPGKKLTTLKLSLNVPLPPSIEATDEAPPQLSGGVQFSPELFFQYKKRGGLNLLPQQAMVGLGGSYAYNWNIHGKVNKSADTGDIVKPLAVVNGRHTFWIGPIPIVVNANVNFSYRFSADGHISLDAQQKTTGAFAVGARYTRQSGWKPLRQSQQETTGEAPKVSGTASATARVGADVAVSLYDAAGVSSQNSVYLKGQAAADRGKLSWALYAGYDMKTSLKLQLKIFGIEVVNYKSSFPELHGERKIFGQDGLALNQGRSG